MITLTSDVGSISINRHLDQSSTWHENRTNSVHRFTDDGSHIGYTQGKKYIVGVLNIKLATQADADALESFLFGIRFGVLPFSISCSDSVNLGRGAQINGCYLNGSASMREYAIPTYKKLNFDLMIPYKTFDPAISQGFGTRR